MRRALILVTVCCALMAGLAAHAQETPAGPSAAIASPTHASIITGERAHVTVLFEAGAGALINAAELYVNGELHDAAAVSPPQEAGSCKLTWYCGEFAQGEHLLTARVYDSSGRSAAVEVAVTLQATRDDAGRTRLEVRIIAPREGQEVSGLTQVRVAVDESRVRYVMLLIDDVFVALTNMPPFAYLLDTTRYLNGLHALKATAFDHADRAHDSPVVNVLINNPGGRTEMRAPAAPAPAAPAGDPLPSSPPAATAAPSAAHTDTGPAAQVSGDARPAAAVESAPRAVIAPSAAPSAPEPIPAEPVTSTPPAAPETIPEARSTAAPAAIEAAAQEAMNVTPAPRMAGAASAPPAARAPAVTAESADLPSVAAAQAAATPAPAPAPATADGREMESAVAAQAAASVESPPMTIAALPKRTPPQPVIGEAAPTSATTAPTAALAPELALPRVSVGAPSIMSDPTLTHIARAPSPPVVVAASAPERGDIIVHAVAPGEQLASISARYGVPAEVIARFNRLRGEAVAAGRELRIPFPSRLLLNGEMVYSDVPLTSEGGIALAPFRAIIEHSGGAVHWLPAARQVRALAFSRDIRVTVDSRQALVDSAQYTLETEARLLHDRAMVPLGLFRDALGFDLTYDPDSGRIYLAAR